MKEETIAKLRSAAPIDEINPDDVIRFLRQHPDFFLHNDTVLSELELPHRAGVAVSLVERQVAVLRERNIESRHRLNRLLETARDNDRLFDKTRQLILALLEAKTLDELVDGLTASIRREFGAEQCRLLLLEHAQQRWSEGGLRLSFAEAETTLKSILRQQRPLVGPLRPEHKAILFGGDAELVLSAAVIPINAANPLAILAVGSHDTKRFHGEMGTLFLEFIGDALQRLLPRFSVPA